MENIKIIFFTGGKRLGTESQSFYKFHMTKTILPLRKRRASPHLFSYLIPVEKNTLKAIAETALQVPTFVE